MSSHRSRSVTPGVALAVVALLVAGGTPIASGTPVGVEGGATNATLPDAVPVSAGGTDANRTVVDPPGEAPTAGNATDANPTRPGSVGSSSPRFVATLPNPAAAGDDGEYVVVAGDGRNLTLSDGETRVRLPAVRGPLLVSASPERVPDRVAGRRVPASLALSNDGERLELRRNDTVVATLTYSDAPAAERRVREAGGWTWRPVGFAPREPHRYGPANVTAFALPDAPSAALEPIRRADERVLLAGYTLSSARVAAALVAARERGVEVAVLLDGAPVGGMSARQAATLDGLVDAGVGIRVVDGPRAPVAFHHPKYAVADEVAVVLTENWKPAGVGGRSSRGWGVVVRSPVVAADLASLFAADAGGPGTVRWREFRRGRTFEDAPPANGSYPTHFEPTTGRAGGVTVLTAPGNAASALARTIDGADERVLVVQPTVGRDSRLLAAALRAAERGVRVRLLLSGAWYVREENEALAERLNARAERGDLPLAVRVAAPRGRYEKIHAKGVVVDDAVAVGSLNWNRHAATENREVVLLLDGERFADYYAGIFAADWRERRSGGSGWYLLAVAVVVGVAGAALRRWW